VIFVDTSAWFALSVPSEPEHGRVVEWLSSNREPLLTTDYIIDEVLTLMRMRREAHRARHLGQQLLEGRIATIEWVLQVDVFQAWRVYQDFEDKNWSFTDCVSRVVMERLGIQTAFALDDDFRQFGTVVVVPNRP
jgi:predicted nucleic acid-binding protein